MALAISAGSALLRRYPRRPAFRARCTSASPWKVVSMIMRAFMNSLRMAMTASMPFMSGKRTSINVMSGCSCRNDVSASRPSAACPMSSMSDCEPMTAAIPSRINGWSSTLKIRMRTSSLMVWLLLAARPALALNPALEIDQYAHTAFSLGDATFKPNATSVTQTADGYLWLGTANGVRRFDGSRFEPWEPPSGTRLPSSTVVKLLAARDGSLWIATARGLSRWISGALTHVTDLDGQYVAALLEDHDG